MTLYDPPVPGLPVIHKLPMSALLYVALGACIFLGVLGIVMLLISLVRGEAVDNEKS